MPIKDVEFGENVVVPYPDLVNLYGCKIGNNCLIAPFVEIQKDVEIGNNTLIESHTFICSKVRIGNNVFVGHGVMFINDRHPVHKNAEDWEETNIEDFVVIGSNATILPCKIRERAMIGAGSVVTKDVSAYEKVVGNPARVVGKIVI